MAAACIARRARDDLAAMTTRLPSGSNPVNAAQKYHGTPPADLHLNPTRFCLRTSMAPELFDTELNVEEVASLPPCPDSTVRSSDERYALSFLSSVPAAVRNFATSSLCPCCW